MQYGASKTNQLLAHINIEDMKEIPTQVKELAKKHGFNSVHYAGEYNGASAYSVGVVDSNGMPTPTGLPTYILLKDNNTSIVDGLEGLDLLIRFQ